MRTFLKPLSFIPAIFLMYLIFSFSSQNGDISGQLSYKVSTKIVETSNQIFSIHMDQSQIDDWANKINFYVRKLGHMTEYFALAVAVAFPLYVYGLHGILLMLVAGFICVGFACTDEWHQSLVAGRSPSIRDVCIDSIGIFFGIILVRIIGFTGRKTIFRPKEEKVKKNKGVEYYDLHNEHYYRNSYAQPSHGDSHYPPNYSPNQIQQNMSQIPPYTTSNNPPNTSQNMVPNPYSTPYSQSYPNGSQYSENYGQPYHDGPQHSGNYSQPYHDGPQYSGNYSQPYHDGPQYSGNYSQPYHDEPQYSGNYGQPYSQPHQNPHSSYDQPYKTPEYDAPPKSNGADSLASDWHISFKKKRSNNPDD